MKKSIASALTLAVVLGAASTTFAAPTDQEVEALKERVAALESLIREQNRVIQEQNRSTASRRDVNELDYRLANLERSSSNNSWIDKFNIGGELRYRYWNLDKRPDFSRLEIRLLPTFTIDNHFAVKARFTGTYNNFQDDNDAAWATNFAYLESKFDNFQVNAGKLPLFTNADQGLVADDFFSGVQAIFGTDTKIQVNAGNFDGSNYIGAEATKTFTDKINAGLGYHYLKQGGTDNEANIIAGGIGFKINEDFGLFGAVAHNTEANNDKTAYNLEGNYKGANRKVKASWGAYAAYRYVPGTVTTYSTYDTFGRVKGKKGFEVGATWTPYQNTLTKLAYFHGKTFGGVDDKTLFARASIFF